MNYVDFLVIAFVLLHAATIIAVMFWLGRFMIVRNQVGDDLIRSREKERKARIPALILVGILAACYVALSILEARLGK